MMKMNTKTFRMLTLLAALVVGVVLISGCTKAPEEKTGPGGITVPSGFTQMGIQVVVEGVTTTVYMGSGTAADAASSFTAAFQAAGWTFMGEGVVPAGYTGAWFEKGDETAVIQAIQVEDQVTVTVIVGPKEVEEAQEQEQIVLTEEQQELNSQFIDAAEKGNLAEVENLLDKGADVNAKDDDGNTALMWASVMGHKKIAELLINKGADVNANVGWTALMWASENGHKEVVELLINNGADVNAKDNMGQTALMKASFWDYKEIVELLEEHGAVLTEEQHKLNSQFIDAAGKGNLAEVENLLDKGADVNTMGYIGLTALMIASHEGHKEVVELLINKGADVNAKDGFEGGTALLYASVMGHEDIVELLKEHGAKE